MPMHHHVMGRARCAVLFLLLSASVVAMASEERMTRYGCYSCHRVAEKLIGPAFRDVAKRYRNVTSADDYLFEKVREGGEGIWGDVPMIANTPEKIPDGELRALITWIRQQ
jgi:cytochrome c